MHTITKPQRQPEIAISPERQPLRPFGSKADRPLTTLRPYWGLQSHRRGYDIRPARSPHQHGMASMLVRRMYAWRGYNSEAAGLSPTDPNRVTLAVWQYDEVVATLTLGRDSPNGLLADALYANELKNLRRPDRLVCEVSRLAVDPDFSSKDLLTSLFKAALQYGKDVFSASDAVFEVNPRHSLYYQRRLGFRQIGDVRQCPRVDAPAVLLHQSLNEIAIPSLMPAFV